MNDNMHISTPGLELIKKFEGFVGHIYNDVGGYPTVGYGHLLTAADKASGVFNAGLTQDAATALLARDVVVYEDQIKKYIKVELNQNQFDALVSMVYNCGSGPLVGGLGKQLNAGNYAAVPTEMMKWCHVGAAINVGLQNRRSAEAHLFTTPVNAPTAPTPTPDTPSSGLWGTVVNLFSNTFNK